MKTRRDILDSLMSQLVRERAGWACESCGKYFPEGTRQSLHASHYHSRRKASTRFDPFNVFAHCFSCHKRLGENPHEFHHWARAKLGDREYELLAIRANTHIKRSKRDKEELKKEMKAELERMRQERRDGNGGRIEFCLERETA